MPIRDNSRTHIMYKIAIIQFPGTNCEYESFRAIKKAGMSPEFFRWNDDYQELKKFDGYFIPGGFSYEDRVRSGAIAGRDPLMSVIKGESAKGKPVIGICNGAQILVESGLISGLEAYHLGSSLAWNERGYLNIWVRIKNESKKGASVFNNYEQGHHFRLPIAHGEGRWVIEEDLLKQLKDNGQTVFRYCDENGDIKDEYPINPNGAVYNLAGVTNPAGNVLALMPHPERTDDGQVIFRSMKEYLEDKVRNPKSEIRNPKQIQISNFKIQKLAEYKRPENSIEFIVDLIITDNEAETLQVALNQLGFNDNIKVRRFTHWEVGASKQSDELVDQLIKSNELLNTNKETPYINDRSNLQATSYKLLARYKDDFVGQAKLDTLNNRLGIKEVKSVKKGVLWEIECSEEVWQKILESNILYNPYSQIAHLMTH